MKTPAGYQSAFMLPVWEGEVWLGKRVNPPAMDSYAAMGGRSEPVLGPVVPFTLATVNGLRVLSQWDFLIENCADCVNLPEGEAPLYTSVRELSEEGFSERPAMPIHDVFPLGYVYDVHDDKRFWLHFYLCQPTQPFSLNRKEVSTVLPLSLLGRQRVAPATRAALGALYHLQNSVYQQSLPEVYRDVPVSERWQREPKLEFVISAPSQMFID